MTQYGQSVGKMYTPAGWLGTHMMNREVLFFLLVDSQEVSIEPNTHLGSCVV